MPPNQRIIGFFAGTSPDDRGRMLREIQQWPDEQLEAAHDFIQWMFPLPERSPVNPSAPVLDEDTIREFRERPELQAALFESWIRMLEFYGFKLTKTPSGIEVGRDRMWGEKSARWLVAGNHNLLRITRILRSLRLLGLGSEAEAFLRCLARIYEYQRAQRWPAITDLTFDYWRRAALPGSVEI